MLPFKMLGPLFLMFLQCDTASTCPTELNPLSLDPPEVIGQYNTTVSFNCTSTKEYHDGIYWREDDIEEHTNFITVTLSLDWHVEAQCKIKLNGTTACSKDLNITVYQDPENVDMFPINHIQDVREDTQYVLQCDILNVAPVKNLVVTWYKDNKIIMTESFTNTTKTPVDESSVLTHNISRGDNGAQFRCEAQLDFGSYGPQRPIISSKTQSVSVHYAPEFKNKTDIDEVYVEEGDNVTLNCEAEGNPASVFHWTVDGVNINISENTSNLYINQVNDSANYSCTASNYLGNITKQMHIHVAKSTMAVATPEPSAAMDCPLTLTPAEIVVRFGDPASINCSTSATDDFKIGWEAVVGGIGSEEPSVPWIVDKLEHWGIEPKCFITLPNLQCTVMPVITLYKTPDNVSISDSYNDVMVEGIERQLTCDIINVAPVRNLTVKWYRGNEIVETQTFNDSTVTPMNVSSTLRIIPGRADDGAHFRCEAELHLGPKGPELIPITSSTPYTARVHYKPVIENCPSRYTGTEHQFKIEMVYCESAGNPPPSVAWFKEEKEIDASKFLTRYDSGDYRAEFENKLGTINTSVAITIEYSASFTCNDHYDVEENVGTPCIAEGMPPPTITWFKDGNEMIPPKLWTRNHSGNYLLIATNRHGKANHTLYLNVQYAPVIEVRYDDKEVTGGGNVTFGCSAEGNPSPGIVWNYTSAGNEEETTWGRQKNINIIGATSTNAGVYNCTATNSVGSVTRSVRLRVKEEYHGDPPLPLWLLILICIAVVIIILLTILIIYRTCKKNKGEYNFRPVTTKDDSNIPMKTMSK
ncbi:intercellular adhesion molecule 5 [Thunnus thynnus]|uniref:intercellular adhesion molecule 5 n=1 Tax=Thunnus thynnus TaxID=8237 RepID=UPI0035275777